MTQYEYALQERIRTFLRLEALFQCLDQDLSNPAVLRSTLRAYLEILDFCQRPELRLDLVLELERILQSLQVWSQDPDVDHAVLDTWMQRFGLHLQRLRERKQAFAGKLLHQEILQQVRGRSAVAGGLASCDLPLLAFWEQQEAGERGQRLAEWREEFQILEESIRLTLFFLRQSYSWIEATAEEGRFSLPLKARQPISLVSLQMDQKADQAYPKISGGLHRLQIQFLQRLDPGPGRALESALAFRLGLSAC